MEEPLRQMKSFTSLDSADRLITAVAAEKGNAGAFHPVIFRPDAVDHLMGINKKASAIVLKSGVIIPVALPLQELKEKIYAPSLIDGNEIDLTAVTGEVARAIVAPRLSDEFNTKAELKIRAIIRQGGENTVKIVEFPESAIINFTEEGSTRAIGKRSVNIAFNTAVMRAPFPGDNNFIDMRLSDFVQLLTEAKSSGQTMLDLVQVFTANPQKYGFVPE